MAGGSIDDAAQQIRNAIKPCGICLAWHGCLTSVCSAKRAILMSRTVEKGLKGGLATPQNKVGESDMSPIDDRGNEGCNGLHAIRSR